MFQETSALYEFGDFRVDTVRRIVLRQGQQLALTAKAFDTLETLIRNRDRVLTKDELLKAIWPNTFVEEANLAQNVSALRKVFGEAPGENRYIATVPGRGYRFVGEVRSPAQSGTELVLERSFTADVAIDEEETRDERQHTWVSWLTRPSGFVPALAILAALGVIAIVMMRRSAADAEKPRSLAVLPFRQLAQPAGDEYLGIGLADAVITRLSNVRQLVVRPTDSVLKYSGPVVDPRAAGRELAVDALLDGKVQKAGDRLRVTVQLIRVADGRPLWAESFDEDSANLFAVEDSVSRKVADTLALHLAGDEKRELARQYTQNVEAYRSYLQGRYAGFRFTRQGLNQAIENFNRAIAQDPSYAIAYAGLADAYTTASDWVLSPREALPKAEAASRKALAFDDRLAEAHSSLAHSLMHQWKLAPAGAEFDRALALNPNNTAIYFAYSEYLSALGKYDESIAALNKALQINPLSAEITALKAWPYYLKVDNQGAFDAGRQTLALDPDFWFGHMDCAMALHEMRRYPEAIAEYEKARAINPDSTLLVAGEASTSADAGDRAKAQSMLAELMRTAQRQYVSPMDIAAIHAALNERDAAFAWLNKAYDDQSEMLLFLRRYTPFMNLRGDPRFDALIARVGVPQ